jgi:hypothetical protein
MFRRTGLVVAALVMAAGLAPVTAAAAAPVSSSASAPYCGTTWGSQAKTVVKGTAAPDLTNIRAGRHACFDRLVFDVRGGNVTGYWVRYVAVMTAPADIFPVPVRGGAKLSVTARAFGYGGAGPTYRCRNCSELVNVSGYRTFRQVTWAGTYANLTGVGLGVRARLPFRVFTLPGRLVVDVAHRW